MRVFKVDESTRDVQDSALTDIPTYDRAVAPFWATYIDDKWFPAMKSIAATQTEEERKNLMKQVEEGLALLEDLYCKISKGKAFFSSGKIGCLDIAFACSLGWLRVTETFSGVKLLDEGRASGLAKSAERSSADVSVEDVMPETGKLFEFAKILWAKMKASPSN